MKKTLITLLLLALNAFAQQTTVAVLPSEGASDVFDNDDLEALTSKVRSVALKVLPRETFTLLTQDVVVKRLGGAENYIKECKESSCIVDLGKKAQVDYVAQASVGKLRNKMRLKVEVYAVGTSGLVGMYDGDGEYFDDYFALLDAVGKNVPSIFEKVPGVVPAPAAAPIAPVAAKYVPAVNNSVSSNVSATGTFTDSREGKRYKAVKIGTQTWMAENLNYNVSGSKCYDNKTQNCDKYGRLYDWSTARNACPKGWHLPSREEWDILMAATGGKETAGKYLKANSGWNDYKGKSGNGEDKFGFSALPGGLGGFGGYFSNIGFSGYWWSAGEYNSDYAYYRNMYYDYEYANWDFSNKYSLRSVRCVGD
jgi:uncharacterized protein (TIGR02145 family)